jgi:flagellar motility protein MotE (MotC chaperone)
MAEAIRNKKPARGVAEDEVIQPQTVEELEREMLGPKNRKPSKPDIPKRPKEKKPMGRIEVAVLASLLWLSVLGAFALLVMFDPTPDRLIRGTVLLLLNPEEETREEYFMSDIIDLQDEWRMIDEERRMLDRFQDELDLREEELDEREGELDSREDELEDRWDTIIENGVDGIAADVTKMANVIGRMQPRNAAQMLEEMDFDNVVRVCLLIPPKRLSPILDVMDNDFRVELGDAMTAEPEFYDWD